MKLADAPIRHGLIPSAFQSMEAYKQYTSKRFLENFRKFIDKVAQAQPLDRAYKRRLNEMARSVVATRGRGIEAWLTLQAYRQCLKEKETPAHLSLVTGLAVAYYAKFAAYEILDDLPALDNDAMRRHAPSIWKKHGEEAAIVFTSMLSAFTSYTILNLALDPSGRLQILEELDFADVQTLLGMSVHMQPRDAALPEALSIALQSHALKVGGFSAHIMAAAALAAHAPEEAATMRKLGYAMAACGQIVNDADHGAVDHDRETNAPNIVATVGWERTEQIFRRYKLRVQQILTSYTHPNEYLCQFLIDLELLLAKRAALSTTRRRTT